METIELLTPERIEADLARNLRAHRLPDLFLYVGDHGAEAWVGLDRSSTFGVASSLEALLRAELDAVIGKLPQGVSLAGIGPGSGDKERLLLGALHARGDRPAYFPVDVSPALVAMALDQVADLDLSATGAVAGLEQLPALADTLPHPLLVTLLGNTFCNYRPDTFFQALSGILGKGDALLLDCHLFRPEEAADSEEDGVAAPYRSPANVRFNLGPLIARGVPADACRFDLRLTSEPTPWGEAYRTRKTIEILRDVAVQCGEETVPLASGDMLEMGMTYKYTADQVRDILADFGLPIVSEHFSDDGANLLVMAAPEPSQELA